MGEFNFYYLFESYLVNAQPHFHIRLQVSIMRFEIAHRFVNFRVVIFLCFKIMIGRVFFNHLESKNFE